MKYSISKDTFREIRRTLSRFLSIFFISALGVAFFAGIKATSRDMKITADKYFDEYNLMDVRLLSTIGFNDEDINAVKKLEGIEGIMPSYSMDALVNIKDREFVLKVISIPLDKLNNPDQSYINRVKLIEGRYPNKPGECVAERGKIIDSGISIGSKIKLSFGTDKNINESLNANEFEIVGIVETPYYISFERGTSSIGNGSVNSYIMISEEDFKYSVYTDVFLVVKGSKAKESYEDSYMDVISPVKDSLEALGEDRAQIRYSEILDDGGDKLDRSKNELADARKKIEDGERELEKLVKPEWYVLDRNTNPGFVDYGNASDSMDAIAGVFPVIFFLVAALVCLTTITRMVDEQRVYIGTYKALGYDKASIAAKYLLYAALASISGSIFGFTLGFKIFPTVIFNAYRIMYTLPNVVTAFNTPYALISTAAAVFVTTLAAWFACYNELKASPAALMRPKSPKPGKRIFLERINFIWSRFNFIKKITARNLFKYKKRFFMTLIGIGGCTALLLTGFGLKDSIMSIVTKQFEELYRYDMILDLKEDLNTHTTSGLKEFLSSDNRISDYMFIRRQNIDVGSDNREKSVIMIVPESTEKMESFIILRERTTGREVPFNDSGVILSEKLAKKLQVQAGDEIYIKNDDGKRISVKVSGIAENYVSHYVYMPPSLYEKVYNQKPEYQQVYAKTTNTSENFENSLSKDMIGNSSISSVAFTTGISKNFADIIGSLNYVVLVLIVSAGALAFVVLYNLTNINVMERLREIATTKVLGFYDNEVSAYVYRENLILTLLGTILGLILGIFLHKFIIVTAEVDYVMFGREIKPLSYVYSGILTILFSGLVNFVMYFRLKRISMVESLKSVD